MKSTKMQSFKFPRALKHLFHTLEIQMLNTKHVICGRNESTSHFYQEVFQLKIKDVSSSWLTCVSLFSYTSCFYPTILPTQPNSNKKNSILVQANNKPMHI